MLNNVPILLAEDDENDVFLMGRAFDRAGIPNPLFVVHNGQEAIDYLSGKGAYAQRDKHPLPGLLLLDLTFWPGCEGSPSSTPCPWLCSLPRNFRRTLTNPGSWACTIIGSNRTRSMIWCVCSMTCASAGSTKPSTRSEE